MPWCDTCDRFLSPSTVQVDGACPTCGHPVAGGPPATAPRGRLRRLPWHVKLLLAVLAMYLTFRLIQGIDWLVHNV